MRIALLAGLVMSSIFGRVPAAQVTFDGCVDAAGRPVASVRDNTINDVANSTAGVIRYNTVVLARYAPQTRLFWYGHECGHQALGHTLGNVSYTMEQAADCFSIRTLVGRHLVDAADVRIIQADLTNSGSGDWLHLPGPQRAINLNRCLGQSDGPGPDPAPRCRQVTDWEIRTDYVTQWFAQNVPCSHCGCTPFGCGCLHAFDVVSVPRQVPVSTRVPVTRTVCG